MDHSVANISLEQLKEWQMAAYYASKALHEAGCTCCENPFTALAYRARDVCLTESRSLEENSSGFIVHTLGDRVITQKTEKPFLLGAHKKQILLIELLRDASLLKKHFEDAIQREAWVELEMLLHLFQEFDAVSELKDIVGSVPIEGIEDKLDVLSVKNQWHLLWALCKVYDGLMGDMPFREWLIKFFSAPEGLNMQLKEKVDSLSSEDTDAMRDALNRSKRVLDFLLNAAELGLLVLLKAFIEIGIDVNLKDTDEGSDKSSALFRAAGSGEVEAMRCLLEAGADIHGSDKHRNTPLHCAALYGHVGAMELLLEAGADPNAKNIEGTSVLKFAIQSGNIRAVQLVLAHGGDPNATDRHGYPVLYSAAWHGDVAAMDLLLGNGANQNVRDRRGRVIMEERDHYSSLSKERIAEVQAVLDEWALGASICRFLEAFQH